MTFLCFCTTTLYSEAEFSQMSFQKSLDQKTKNWVSANTTTSISQVFDEQLISCSADWTCKVWNVKMAQCIHTLKGHSGAVMAMCVDREQVHVFTASKDSTIRKWNIRSGHCLHIYSAFKNLGLTDYMYFDLVIFGRFQND